MVERIHVRSCTVLFVAGAFLPLAALDLLVRTAGPWPSAAAPQIFYPLWQQITLFTSAFLVKPLYMTLALLSAGLLWRRDEEELVALRRAMLVFFLGEAACALNYLLCNDRSLLLEYWHDYGMIACFSLATYAVLQAFDARICHYSAPDKRCALLALCGGCYKQGTLPCSLLQLFLCLLPAAIVFAALPWTVMLEHRSASGVILDKEVLLAHPLSHQWLEVRFFPLVAMLLLGLALIVLLRHREAAWTPAKLYFAAGCGPLVFSLLRLLCYWGFGSQLLWANVWEEVSELLFVGLVLFVTLKVRGAFRTVKGAVR